MVLSKDIYDMIRPTRRVGGYDQYGNWVETVVDDGETYEEYLKRTGQRPGPSVTSQIVAGVLGGVAGYQMSKRKHDKSKKEKDEELERQRKEAIRQAQAKRLESDRELIRKRALEQVRIETLRNYNYHEMMTHYFLGIDSKGRPFDVDKYGIPYYLDTDSLAYTYYSKDNMDSHALDYSDAKRQRLGLPSLNTLPMSSWVYGETIDNNPRNIENILAEEAQIKAQLEQYKATMQAREQMVKDAEQSISESKKRQKDDDVEYGF